jgi:hypothetical protein
MMRNFVPAFTALLIGAVLTVTGPAEAAVAGFARDLGCNGV